MKYRGPVFTDAMLTFCEHTMRAVCADLDTKLAEFNGDADNVHLLVAYPPQLAISTPVQRLNGRCSSHRFPTPTLRQPWSPAPG
jgi:putative transposase